MDCCKLGKLHVFTYLLWLWWWTTTSIHVKAASHSLKPGDTLNATTDLCSENGEYCMGFFPTTKLDDRTFFGIYSKIQENRVAWVADRNQPIFNNSGLLSLDHSGDLKLESQDGEPIILYSSPQATNNNTEATLLDTGNFVLQQLHPNGSTKSVLWQSFDDPSDTLIPGMRLGVNHKTGRTWSLVSRLSGAIRTRGHFKLEWEPRGGELIIKRQEQVYWTSGKLKQ